MSAPPVPPCPPPPNEGGFSIEAVIVCDKYHDFLRNTLPYNKFLFDRLVVVTSPEDLETQKICEFYHVQLVLTDALQSRWKKFCKGAGINAGLAALSKKNWVVQMDADICLPPQTRILLERACLDKSQIYGIDRFNVRGFKAWQRFRDQPVLQHECDSYIHMNAFPIGTRLMHAHEGGWLPIGFFQLWNPLVSKVLKYPEANENAGHTDTLFSSQWPRAKRAFIPEIVAYHLESMDAGNAKNWAGRQTKAFDMSEPET